MLELFLLCICYAGIVCLVYNAFPKAENKGGNVIQEYFGPNGGLVLSKFTKNGKTWYRLRCLYDETWTTRDTAFFSEENLEKAKEIFGILQKEKRTYGSWSWPSPYKYAPGLAELMVKTHS